MVKYLNIAMDDDLKKALEIKKGKRGWIQFFKDLTEDNPKTTEKPKKIEKEAVKSEKKPEFQSADDFRELKPKSKEGVPVETLLKRWVDYSDGMWNQGMVTVVEQLKYCKKSEYDAKKEKITEEMKANGYTEEQIERVISKSKELKQLFIQNKSNA